jgi:hypothetical protein
MSPNERGPVFIIGTERSGSNLLRLILNRNPAIYIPHPPHLMKDLGPVEHLYGDLSVDVNFRRLVNAAARLVELHFSPWEIKPDREEAFAAAAARRLYCVKARFYDQYRRFRGAARWGCKSTFMVHYADQARRYSPGSRFVHLVRDGRDVAVSAKKSVFNHFHPYYVARLWSAQQRLAAQLASRLGHEEFLTVRYEDLLADPERETRRLCGFLGEDYSPDMLNYFEDREARGLAGLSGSWENCGKPILRDNAGKYRGALSAQEVRIFEAVAGKELALYGYAPAGVRPPSGNFTPARRAGFWLAEKLASARVRLAAFFTDRNSPLMLKKDLFLIFAKFKIRIIDLYGKAAPERPRP